MTITREASRHLNISTLVLEEKVYVYLLLIWSPSKGNIPCFKEAMPRTTPISRYCFEVISIFGGELSQAFSRMADIVIDTKLKSCFLVSLQLPGGTVWLGSI